MSIIHIYSNKIFILESTPSHHQCSEHRRSSTSVHQQPTIKIPKPLIKIIKTHWSKSQNPLIKIIKPTNQNHQNPRIKITKLSNKDWATSTIRAATIRVAARRKQWQGETINHQSSGDRREQQRVRWSMVAQLWRDLREQRRAMEEARAWSESQQPERKRESEVERKKTNKIPYARVTVIV